MLIKKRDSRQAEIDQLTPLLSRPLPENKKFLIERELRFLKSGDRGENDAAYFIDFHFGNGKNWAVIHDIRLECGRRVAQIDHLLINRFLEFYVLESKNFSYGLKITDAGEFMGISSGNKYVSIESPLEQNIRHMLVLEDVIRQYDIMPKRLGISMPPTFKSYILISTKSRLIRPSPKVLDTSMVIKADTLRTKIDKDMDSFNPISNLATMSKIVSQGTVREIAERLAAVHRPVKIDYRKRFGEENAAPPPTDQREKSAKPKKYFCFNCKKTITERVAKFCWDNERRFNGKAYCFDCQKQCPRSGGVRS